MGVLIMCCNGRWGRGSSSDYDEQRQWPVVLDDEVHNAMRREMRRGEDFEVWPPFIGQEAFGR
jgi:hypothetical protein